MTTRRQGYLNEAEKSIEASYAGPQTLIGPVQVLPYTQTTVTLEDGEEGKRRRVEHVAELAATAFPRVLNVRGTMQPTERRHGLHTVTVYEFAAQMKGTVEIVPLPTMMRGVGFGGLLTTLYGAGYGLLISEDNALILGSLLLFAVLAGVMMVTRKVDWYKGKTGSMKSEMATASPSPIPGGGL